MSSGALLGLLAIGWQVALLGSALGQISVDIEPRSAQFGFGAPVVHYERVAPSGSGQVQGRVCLRVAITNTGPSLQLNKVTVALAGTNYDFVVTPGIAIPTVPATGVVSAIWFNNLINASSSVPSPCPLIALPAPISGTLTLSFSGTSPSGPLTQATTFALKAHDGPDYSFPFKSSDRPAGEFWEANSIVHGAGTEGSQLFAYDVMVVGFDTVNNGWSQCKTPGVDCSAANTGLKNTDFRDWGTPIYAMANGTVVHCVSNVPLNPQPWGCCPQAGKPIDSSNRCTNVTTYPGTTKQTPGSGNSFYIQHGDEVVLYAHMQPADSTCSNFNCAKCVVNTDGSVAPLPITKGELLGRVGNSGNVCGQPHTHIHSMLLMPGIVDNNGFEQRPLKLRPLPFSDAYALDISAIDSATFTGPWVKLDKMGPPPVWSLISDLLPVAVPPITVVELAIDPMALILPPKWYVIWAELKHPHGPTVAEIQQVLRSMPLEEQKATVDRAKTLGTYGKAVEEAFATIKK